jgi:hypothetical protein
VNPSARKPEISGSQGNKKIETAGASTAGATERNAKHRPGEEFTRGRGRGDGARHPETCDPAINMKSEGFPLLSIKSELRFVGRL